eukprot:scaffold33557_cov27-Tisochrysis_lutea.AAC.1
MPSCGASVKSKCKLPERSWLASSSTPVWPAVLSFTAKRARTPTNARRKSSLLSWRGSTLVGCKSFPRKYDTAPSSETAHRRYPSASATPSSRFSRRASARSTERC